MTPAVLLIPLAVLAAAAALGWLGHRQHVLAPHAGNRCKPRRRAHLLGLDWSLSARWRCRRKGVIAAGYRTPWGAWREARSMIRYNASIEDAQTLAWVSRIEQHHEISPAAAAQIQAHVMGKLAERIQPVATLPSWAEPATGPIWPAAWEPVPAASGPVPAAMADVADDPDYPYLAAGQLGHTGQFAAVIDAIKGEL